MNKIGIIVLGAKAPKILGRALEFFHDPRFRIFLHLDAKINLETYLREMSHPERVTLVEPRVAVFWGGFTMIEAEFALIRAALDDPEIGGLVLVSDDSAPLRGPDAVYRALIETPDRIACEVRGYTQEWYRKIFFGDSNFTGYLKNDVTHREFKDVDWENVKRLQRFAERGKKNLDTLYFSRQWWALSRASVEAIMSLAASDEHLLESFRYSLFPDETFFPTLYRLCFPHAKAPDVPMYADYERQPIPGVFAHVHELPDLEKLPEHCLFFRKIWPWSPTVADKIMRIWLPAATVAAVVPATDPTNDDEKYTKALSEAIEAREDGDLEESLPLFEAALALRPGDAKASMELANTLNKLRRVQDADAVLTTALEWHPRDAGLRHAWADIPARLQDHEEVIRRTDLYAELFPPAEHHGIWHSIAVQYASYTESLRWAALAEAIRSQKQAVTRSAPGLRICLWQAGELCLAAEQRAMVAAAQPSAWGELPAEAKGNINLRLDMIDLNRKLLEEAEVRVISVGQNCLPYLLGGRWGLIDRRESPEAVVPFDRGAFYKDNTAEVIANDFATFDQPGAYDETKSWEGIRMYRHAATGVYFYHERGATWLRNDGERFFPRVNAMVDRWRQVSTTGRRLFVFCLCGEGDLGRLVDVMARQLLGPEAQLLVVDVTQKPHDCPVLEGVTYLHMPYPKDYVWDNFKHQLTATGVRFELEVATAIVDQVLTFLPGPRAAVYRQERWRIIQNAARAAVQWKHDHDNGVALYRILYRLDPDNRDVAMAFAKALRDNGKASEAEPVLLAQIARNPEAYEEHAAWAEIGVSLFDWPERLRRLRALHEKFPPEMEARSWTTLAEELRLLADHGCWDEAIALIDARWHDVLARGALYRRALETLIQLGHRAQARRLLDEAGPAARATVTPETMVSLLSRLNAADANEALLRQTGTTVLALGQTTLAGMLMTRWGFRVGPNRFDQMTPFDLGDVFRDAPAEAIADDFAVLSQRENYLERPAWGGGVTLRHKPSGVTFMVHRAAKGGQQQSARFFAHLDRMVANWREMSVRGRRIFVYVFSEQGDLGLLIAEATRKLLGVDGRLVIIDLHELPSSVPEDARIVYLHARTPKNYNGFAGLGSAIPEAVAYEARVLAPVVGFLERFALEDAAMSIAAAEPNRAAVA